MATASVNGVSLEYQETGTGDPVVFVHGALSDHRTWQVQRESLGPAWRAISFSGRSNWPNAAAPPDAEHRFDVHVDDLLALVDELDAAPAHLVGHSSGGLLCLLAASRAPDLVRSLVLLEPFALPLLTSVPPRPLEILKLAFRHPRTAGAVIHFGAFGMGPTQAAFERGDLERGSQTFFRAVFGERGVRRMTAPRREQARANLATFASELTRGTFPSTDPNDFRRIDVPTLLLTGSESPSIMHRFTDRVNDLLPEAERKTISGASHDAQCDNPSDVTAAISAFLASLS